MAAHPFESFALPSSCALMAINQAVQAGGLVDSVKRRLVGALTEDAPDQVRRERTELWLSLTMAGAEHRATFDLLVTYIIQLQHEIDPDDDYAQGLQAQIREHIRDLTRARGISDAVLLVNAFRESLLENEGNVDTMVGALLFRIFAELPLLPCPMVDYYLRRGPGESPEEPALAHLYNGTTTFFRIGVFLV